jgi:prevent-host-death family protein
MVKGYVISGVMGGTSKVETISISEFKTKCLAVIDRVRRTGRPILVTRRGKPMAQVIPPPAADRLASWLGCMAGRGKTRGDIISPAGDASEWEALR